jgi:hypothetical protein
MAKSGERVPLLTEVLALDKIHFEIELGLVGSPLDACRDVASGRCTVRGTR